MAMREITGRDVFDEAVHRLAELYAEGHTLAVSFSGGKDSTVTLECAILAARETGRLPVHVVMRDDEVMLPGTFEYCERVAARPEVDFHWLIARQPVINAFNRAEPYWWCFDPLLQPEEWVRQPPAFAEFLPDMHIQGMTTPQRFPAAPGKTVFAVVGIRAQESNIRRFSVHAAGGHLTKPNKYEVRNCRPIYDWKDGDVWRAIRDNKWDYNTAYDTLLRHGVPSRELRIAPPTMSVRSVSHQLRVSALAWPAWFDKVDKRCPGVRTAVRFGRRAVLPERLSGESWKETFQRECIDKAPRWIALRAKAGSEKLLHSHERHANVPFPDNKPCYKCTGSLGSWKSLTHTLYSGDPFAFKATMLPYVEPEAFRPGAGTWGGKPTF